jgi:hypothetical protein
MDFMNDVLLVGARLAREANDTVFLIHRIVSFAGKPRSNITLADSTRA